MIIIISLLQKAKKDSCKTVVNLVRTATKATKTAEECYLGESEESSFTLFLLNFIKSNLNSIMVLYNKTNDFLMENPLILKNIFYLFRS